VVLERIDGPAGSA